MVFVNRGVRGLFAVSKICASVFTVTAVFSTSNRLSARPRKSLGQHFLADGRIAERILNAAELDPDDVVIEVGPGRGALTGRLTQKAGRVVAVELDQALAQELPGRLNNPANLTVIQGDARTLDTKFLEVVNSGYKVVANLPYYAANPITRHFLELDIPPTLMVIMVQKEVAEAMSASPGKMSLLSVATQFYASAELAFTVPPASFRPAPKVSSAVVRLKRRPAIALDGADIAPFFDLVRAGFSAPRKQLRNSLCHGLKADPEPVTNALGNADVDGKRRAETLTLEEWVTVFRAFSEAGGLRQVPGLAAC